MPRSKVVKPARRPVGPSVRNPATGKFIKSVDLSTSGSSAPNKEMNQSVPSEKPSVPKQAGAAKHWLVTVPVAGNVPGGTSDGTDGTNVVPGGEVTLIPSLSACVPVATLQSCPNMEGTSGVVPMVPGVPSQNRLECHVIREWVIEHCHDASWQMERGTGDTGYLHWQIYIHCKKRVRLTWLKAHFNPSAHYEACKAIDKSNAYCFKHETRVEGPYHWPEPAAASDVKDPLDGIVLRPWQQQVVDYITGPISDRTVHWFYEEVGHTGKTTLAKHLVLKHGAVVIQGAGKDILHQASKCKDTKLYILDIPRCSEGHVSYQAIEALKNGLWFSGKYEGSMCVRNPAHVVCFSNHHPDVSMLSRDRWNLMYIEADGRCRNLACV